MCDRAANQVHQKGLYVHQSASHAATAMRPESRTRAVSGSLAAMHQKRVTKASTGGGRGLREPRSSPLGRKRRGQSRARAAQAARTGRGDDTEAARRARHGGPSDAFCEGWRPARGGRTGDQVQAGPSSCRSTRCAAAIARSWTNTNRTQTQTSRCAGRRRRRSPAAAAPGRPDDQDTRQACKCPGLEVDVD